MRNNCASTEGREGSASRRRGSDAIDVPMLLDVLSQGRRVLFGAVLAATAVAALVAFFGLDTKFRSQATLQPVSKAGVGDLGLGGVASLMSGLDLGGILDKDQNEKQLMNFLESRAFAERLIRTYDLLPVLYEEGALSKLLGGESRTVVKALQEDVIRDVFGARHDKASNLIEVSWISEDPAFAALMLERVVHQLQGFLDSDFMFEARRTRIFIEDRLAKAKDELVRWEKAVPSSDLPMSEIVRERLAGQEVYLELRKQYELAKINEARDVLSFKVLDPPFVPEKKYWPRRGLLIVSVMLGTAFLVSLGLVARRLSKRILNEPED